MGGHPPVTRLFRHLPRARRLRTLEEEDANEGYMSGSLHELRSGSAAARSCPKGYYERSFSSISSKLAARALDLSTLITTLSSALASILAIFRACFVSVRCYVLPITRVTATYPQGNHRDASGDKCSEILFLRTKVLDIYAQ